MKQSGSSVKYIFKVYLKGNRRTWRTVALRGDHTLDDLHEIIYSAFDRDDEHLYSFYFPKVKISRDPFSIPPKEYTSPNNSSMNNQLSYHRTYNAAKVKIDTLELSLKDTFEYLFDFGDMWWHVIKLIGIDPVDKQEKLPLLIESHNGSPQYNSNNE
jgi:hypothetical protein